MPNQVRQWPMWPSGDPACSSRARAARARAPALLNPPARVAMFAHARCEHFPPREPGKALIVAGLRRSDVQMTAITCEREATQRSAPHDHRHAYHHRFVLRGGMPSHLRCRLASYSCVCLRSCSSPLYAMHYYGYALHALPRPGGLELGSIPSRG